MYRLETTPIDYMSNLDGFVKYFKDKATMNSFIKSYLKGKTFYKHTPSFYRVGKGKDMVDLTWENCK